MRSALVLFAVLAAARGAHAECASPRSVAFSPLRGSLPEYPSIYVFVPHGDPTPLLTLEIRGARGGPPRLATARLLVASPAYAAYRATLDVTREDGPITVRLWGQEAHYDITDVPDQDRAFVDQVGHRRYDWTCSSNDTLELSVLGNAVAYLVRWDDGESAVLPQTTDVLWGEQYASSVPSVALGGINCLGWNTDPEQMANPRGFTLIALFSDGSEQAIGRAIAQLGEGDDEVRLPVELVEGMPPATGWLRTLLAGLSVLALISLTCRALPHTRSDCEST